MPRPAAGASSVAHGRKAVPPQPNIVWTTLCDQQFQPAAGLWPVAENATPVDYAYALDPEQARFLIAARVNGQMIPLRTKLAPLDPVELITAPGAEPSATWLAFASSPAAELIKHQLGLKMTDREREIVQSVMSGLAEHVAAWRTPRPAPDFEPQRRKSYTQPNREGKRLIGAYVAVEDIEKLKAILQARGTTVQDYFGQIVANEIAAAGKPGELEKLIEAQLDRFRATLRPTLKR